jgi:hypothetical protein
MPITYWTDDEVEQHARAVVKAERDACMDIACHIDAANADQLHMAQKIADEIAKRNKSGARDVDDGGTGKGRVDQRSG